MQRARNAQADAAGAAGDVRDLALHISDGWGLRWSHVGEGWSGAWRGWLCGSGDARCNLSKQSGGASSGRYASENLAAVQVLFVHRFTPVKKPIIPVTPSAGR